MRAPVPMSPATAVVRPPQPARRSRAAALRQVVASFVAVVACYWVYWFVAVPLIEPSLEDRRLTNASDEEIDTARGAVNSRQRAVAEHFRPDDWEAQKPAISQIGRMRLLFKTLEPETSDGSVNLVPCTLMLFPEEGDRDKPERPIIMRAERANVRFDEPIELASFDFRQRKFVGASLIGPIHVFRQASAPGAADDLEITTRDIEMDSQRAWTDAQVDFRLGRSHGSGRDLEILLGAADGSQPNDMRDATFRQLLLKRDVKMRLELGSGPLAGPESPARAPDAQPPIEITCQGRFQFEADEYAASFHDNVDVFRLNPSGQSDQLNCALLTIFFARPGDPAPEVPPGSPSGGAASQVRMIEARGDPVTLRSPAQGMYARCKGVDYIPGTGGMPGSLAAFGPGVIQGNLPNDPAGKYVAQWARQLRFEPDGPMQRATLRGAAVVRFGVLGTITADEVFAWLSRKPQPPQAPIAQVAHRAAVERPLDADTWQIQRVVARRYPDPNAPGPVIGPPHQDAGAISQGDVVIDGPQLHAVASVLEAIVDRQAAGAAAPLGTGEPGRPERPQRPGDAQRRRPTDRFDVRGGSVHIQLVPNGEDLAVSGATILGDAQLAQFPLVAPKPQPSLLIKGNRLQVVGVDTPDTRVTIAGEPGYVEAGGMTLWGGAIELERRTNWLWINGPGRLAMPITQDLDGKPLAQAQSMTVDWKQRMDFQSDTATFQGTVVARSQQQVLNTERLEAVLTQPVDFGNPNVSLDGQSPGKRPELAEVRSVGRTFLESRQLDEAGAQTSFSQMELADLAIQRQSGQISGRGPGWVKHVSRGGGPQLLGPAQAGQARPDAPKTPDAPPQPEYTYLFVTFQKGLDGNIKRRTVRFFDRTRTIYGPVDDWNARIDGHDLDALGPQGMLLDADELEIREMNRRPDSKRGYFELDASGGVSAEGQRFTAQGTRLTYSEEKDQLILRGDPAELYLENETGGPRHETRAAEVAYWFARNYVSVSGARNATIGVPQNATRRPSNDAKPKLPAPPGR